VVRVSFADAYFNVRTENISFTWIKRTEQHEHQKHTHLLKNKPRAWQRCVRTSHLSGPGVKFEQEASDTCILKRRNDFLITLLAMARGVVLADGAKVCW